MTSPIDASQKIGGSIICSGFLGRNGDRDRPNRLPLDRRSKRHAAAAARARCRGVTETKCAPIRRGNCFRDRTCRGMPVVPQGTATRMQLPEDRVTGPAPLNERFLRDSRRSDIDVGLQRSPGRIWLIRPGGALRSDIGRRWACSRLPGEGQGDEAGQAQAAAPGTAACRTPGINQIPIN